MTKKLNQLFNIESIIGKTIKRTYRDYCLFIVFEDDSFIVFEDFDVASYKYGLYDYEMEEIGLATQEEREIAQREYDLFIRKQREELEAAEEQRNKERELKLLAELKEKYERA